MPTSTDATTSRKAYMATDAAAQPPASATPALTVSVALGTHNGARFLREQLESILVQTRPVDEIVLSDDASRRWHGRARRACHRRASGNGCRDARARRAAQPGGAGCDRELRAGPAGGIRRPHRTVRPRRRVAPRPHLSSRGRVRAASRHRARGGRGTAGRRRGKADRHHPLRDARRRCRPAAPPRNGCRVRRVPEAERGHRRDDDGCASARAARRSVPTELGARRVARDRRLGGGRCRDRRRSGDRLPAARREPDRRLSARPGWKAGAASGGSYRPQCAAARACAGPRGATARPGDGGPPRRQRRRRRETRARTRAQGAPHAACSANQPDLARMAHAGATRGTDSALQDVLRDLVQPV